MTARTFIANFFRQNTNESSTRLVGILGFMIGVLLAAVAVVAALFYGKVITGAVITVIGLVLADASVALGLRKPGAPGADDPPADAASK